ncbi:MAG: transcriptional repressor [Hyphomicrobiales bacterium]|nr:transcriptional repressor [Hyphomicrobiales bacterium]
MSDNLFPTLEHDHNCCVDMAVGKAREICRDKSVKLTPLREAVFRVLLSSHKALGAYDIIESLKSEGREVAPISAYRIIEVLVDTGLVHRLESKNAYFACLSEHDDERSLLILICEGCARVAEADAHEAGKVIADLTRSSGFRVNNTVLEIHGYCAECGNKRTATGS